MRLAGYGEGRCKQNPYVSKPKFKPASAELFKQFPFKQSPGPLLRQLSLQLAPAKSNFKNIREQESARYSLDVCVIRKHPVGGTLVTAQKVSSPPMSFVSVLLSSHADVRLLSV